jgi:WD40 repeat protein
VLETPESILKGGTEGPSVIAGKSAESLLFKLVAHQTDPVMPPEDNDVGAKNFTPEQLGLLKLWIDEGAKGEVASTGGPIEWQPLPASVNPVYALDVSPHGEYVAAGRANQIWIYGVPSKHLVTRLTDPTLIAQGESKNPGVAHLDLVQSLAFSPDGKWLASGGYREVKLWERPVNPQKGKFEGLEGEPQSLAVSPDGKWAAVGEVSGKVKLIELATGKAAKTIEGHTATVSGVAFSTDGALLATGSQDKTFRVIQLSDDKELGRVETPSPVNAVAFVLENKQIATGHPDNKLLTWHSPGTEPPPAEGQEPMLPKPIKELNGHGGPVTCLIALAGGSQLLSGSHDGTVRLWDPNSGNMQRQFNHGGAITAIAASRDGQKVASASNNNTAKVFRFDNFQQLAEVRGDHRLRYAADDLGRVVALARRHVENAKKDLDEANNRKKSEDENAKKADENKKKTEEEMKKKEEAAKGPLDEKAKADAEFAALMPELEKAQADKTAAEKALEDAKAARKAAEDKRNAAGDDQAKKDEAQKELDEANKKLQEAQNAANELTNNFNDTNNRFKQAENKVKEKAGPAQKATDELNAAKRAFEAAERSIARSAEAVKKATEELPSFETAHKAREEELKQREMQKQQADQAIAAGDKPQLAIAFAADGAVLATAGDDMLVHLWSSENGAPLEIFEGQGAAITALAPTDGGLIALGKNSSGIVWDTAAPWKLVRTIGTPDAPQFSDRVTALHFSPDSSLLATGGGEPSRSGELKIFKVQDGSLVRDVKDAHSDTIFDVEFSPDGKLIASCAADRFAKVHSAETGAFVRAFEGHTHHVMGVSWRADGRMLATSGADMSVKVWDFLTGDQFKTMTGWRKEVTAVKFVGTTDDMITAAGDPQISLRDTNGNNKGGYGGPNDFMYTARVSADGKTFVASGQDSIVRVWNDQKQTIINFDPPKVETPAADEQTARN